MVLRNPKVARQNFTNANVSHLINLIVAPALDTLPTLGPDGSYDLAFIDANKTTSLEYFLEAKRLVRPGGIIIVDNVVRRGLVADPEQEGEYVDGARRLLVYLRDVEREFDATTIATVGDKGYDGFLYGIRL